MTEFQGLITGAIAGCLMAKADPSGPFVIDVEVPRDEDGNYRKEVIVTGRESGEVLRVSVEPLYDTPETVKAKVEQARMVEDIARRHLT